MHSTDRLLGVILSAFIFLPWVAATTSYFDFAARMIESNVGRGQGLGLGGQSTGQIELVT